MQPKKIPPSKDEEQAPQTPPRRSARLQLPPPPPDTPTRVVLRQDSRPPPLSQVIVVRGTAFDTLRAATAYARGLPNRERYQAFCDIRNLVENIGEEWDDFVIEFMEIVESDVQAQRSGASGKEHEAEWRAFREKAEEKKRNRDRMKESITRAQQFFGLEIWEHYVEPLGTYSYMLQAIGKLISYVEKKLKAVTPLQILQWLSIIAVQRLQNRQKGHRLTLTFTPRDIDILISEAFPKRLVLRRDEVQALEGKEGNFGLDLDDNNVLIQSVDGKGYIVEELTPNKPKPVTPRQSAPKTPTSGKKSAKRRRVKGPASPSEELVQQVQKVSAELEKWKREMGSDLPSLPNPNLPIRSNPIPMPTAVDNGIWELVRGRVRDEYQGTKTSLSPMKIPVIDRAPLHQITQSIRDLARQVMSSNERNLENQIRRSYVAGLNDISKLVVAESAQRSPAGLRLQEILRTWNAAFGGAFVSMMPMGATGAGRVMTYRALETLLLDETHIGWLSDEVITAAIRQYIAYDDVHIVEPTAWAVFMQAHDRQNAAPPPIPAGTRIAVIPINWAERMGATMEGMHWTLGVVNFQTGRITHLDSQATPVRVEIGMQALERWVAAMGHFGHRPATAWTRDSAQSEQQDNNADCGLWVIENALTMIEVGMPTAELSSMQTRLGIGQMLLDQALRVRNPSTRTSQPVSASPVARLARAAREGSALQITPARPSGPPSTGSATTAERRAMSQTLTEPGQRRSQSGRSTPMAGSPMAGSPMAGSPTASSPMGAGLTLLPGSPMSGIVGTSNSREASPSIAYRPAPQSMSPTLSRNLPTTPHRSAPTTPTPPPRANVAAQPSQLSQAAEAVRRTLRSKKEY